MKRILVLGATSAIAQQSIRLWASRGEALFLVGRNPENLKAVASDATTRGAKQAEECVADLDALAGHAALVQRAKESLGGTIDIVLLAHGVLGDPAQYNTDVNAAVAIAHTNFTSPVSLLTLVAPQMTKPGGVICGIGSVAGDRGRGSNSLYGATKAGLEAFLSGLRNRLFKDGVHVVTVKPGMVDTPMTSHLKKGPLFASAKTVGERIVWVIDRKKDVAYAPRIWWVIMTIIRSIPEVVFKRLSL